MLLFLLVISISFYSHPNHDHMHRILYVCTVHCMRGRVFVVVNFCVQLRVYNRAQAYMRVRDCSPARLIDLLLNESCMYCDNNLYEIGRRINDDNA